MRPKPKKRRVLLNWDGDDLMAMADAPMGREQFVSLAFDPITDSTVDALLWCSAGGNEAVYRSEVMEPMGENFNFKFPDYDGWRRYANALSLMESGEDQLAIVCAEAGKRGIEPFFSLRMNDCHDAWLRTECRPKIKREHPEWLLGETMGEFHTALNYAQPGLRDLRRRQIAEIFESYDFVGLELDWLRHSVHLELDYEYRLRYVLTDLTREIRATLDEIGERKGRYIELIPRVPETIEACLREGYDVVAWLGEDLVDGVILGQGHSIPSDYAAWRALMTQRQVPLYPCVYGYGAGHKPYPDDAIYAIAASYLDAGSDGLYTFNWYPYGEFRKQLLATVGDRQALIGRSKRYHADQRYLAIYTRGSRVQAALPVELWPTTRDSGPEIPIYCADDLAASPPKSIELAMSLHRFGAQDRVEVRLNGTPLSGGHVEACVVGDEYFFAIGGPPTFRAVGKVWMRFELRPAHIVRGVNIVTVVLRERNPDITTNVVLDRVELTVSY